MRFFLKIGNVFAAFQRSFDAALYASTEPADSAGNVV